MSRAILFLDGQYLIWSSVVDAPVTHLMTLDELREYVRETQGTEGLAALPARLRRVHETGTSMYNMTIDDHIACNRAGENEECLTREQIIEGYTATPVQGEEPKP